jgi:hypothetical protein
MGTSMKQFFQVTKQISPQEGINGIDKTWKQNWSLGFLLSLHGWNMQPSNHYKPKICTLVFQKTNVPYLCIILCPHSSDYNIVQPVDSQRTFRKIITLPSSALKRNPGKIPASSYIIFGLFLNHEDGGDMLLWNVGWILVDYTALYPRIFNSVISLFICVIMIHYNYNASRISETIQNS